MPEHATSITQKPGSLMPIEVELPNGAIAEFPDGMSHEQISEALRRRFPPSQAVSQSQQQPGAADFPEKT